MVNHPLGDQPVPPRSEAHLRRRSRPHRGRRFVLRGWRWSCRRLPTVSRSSIYDPGGTVCVIDRITGSNRQRLLNSALAVAFERGDVLVNVIVAEDDSELSHLAVERGLQRTVDVFSWP